MVMVHREMSQSVNERKQAERDRRRALGQVNVQEWVHRDDAERLRAYAARLRKARAKTTAGI